MPLTVTSFVAVLQTVTLYAQNITKGHALSAAELTSQLGLFCLLIARELRILSFFKF